METFPNREIAGEFVTIERTAAMLKVHVSRGEMLFEQALWTLQSLGVHETNAKRFLMGGSLLKTEN